jgi:hypothetical protein
MFVNEYPVLRIQLQYRYTVPEFSQPAGTKMINSELKMTNLIQLPCGAVHQPLAALAAGKGVA